MSSKRRFVLVRIPIQFGAEVFNVNDIEEYAIMYVDEDGEAKIEWTNDVDQADTYSDINIILSHFKDVYGIEFRDLYEYGYHCYISQLSAK